MRIEYEPAFADYKAAYIAYRKKTRASAAINFISFKLLPLAAVVFTILAIVQARQGRIDPLIYKLAPLLLTVTVVAFVNRYFYIRRQVKNLFPVGATDRRIIAEIGEESVVTSIPGARRTEYSWQSISLFISSARVNLLYISPERFVLIPSRALTTEDKAALHEIVARKGIKTKLC